MTAEQANLRAPRNEKELEEILSRPSPSVIESLAELNGDLAVLGAGGKMGPSLARMARRALEASGSSHRVIAVSRFSDAQARAGLEGYGIHTISCDFLNREHVSHLPDAPNVVYMAGFKFGATAAPEMTWAVNAFAPALIAERYKSSRIVAFSTGCVYPNAPIGSPGSIENDPLEPLGEYANACVGRERILEYFSRIHSIPMAFVRLNYANDLRYGVLVDVARAVWEGNPIDLTTGWVNVIWQGDANADALRLLEHTTTPPSAINITGPDKVSVRELALKFGELLRREPVFVGEEASTALLSDSTKARLLLGEPEVSLEQMIAWTAEWIRSGGRSLNKPTHYESRDGRY